jgi:hypothetical protein
MRLALVPAIVAFCLTTAPTALYDPADALKWAQLEEQRRREVPTGRPRKAQ